MAQHRYRQVRVPRDHPIAVVNTSLDKAGTVYVHEHRLVLWDKIGPGTHPCHWCGKPLRWASGTHAHADVLTADHVNGDHTDNRPENLVQSCHGCNIQRTRRVPDDELFVIREGKRNRAEERVCLTCGQTFLVSVSQLRSKSNNAGRYCSMRCVYNRKR